MALTVEQITDPHIASIIDQERERQQQSINLIASENYAPREILQATGSVLTNKYAEGYPGKRYYSGCEQVDQVEQVAIERCKKLFGAQHVNVQPHAGSQANMAAYLALIKPGDTIMGMSLREGGHLTHGHPVNFSGLFFKVVSYGVNKETELIDYDELERHAQRHQPKLIISGASAYPRTIDFERISHIAHTVGAYHVADIAHIAGLVATKLHPSPIPHADVVTSTTHKTLRGPRGGLIMCKEKYAQAIDKMVMPGIQGGPLMHVIAAKAVCFKLAQEKSFVEYQKQVIANARTMAQEFERRGYRVVTGGTDNHLFLVDLRSKKITGKRAEEILAMTNISINRNLIPFDPEKPLITSGIRIGTPAITTRGMKEQDVLEIVDIIDTLLLNEGNETVFLPIQNRVKKLCDQFPIYD